MDAISAESGATELEAMCKEDSSWHPCQVSLSSTEDSLIVAFGSQELEDMVWLNKDEAFMHLRFRSAPLQDDDCSHIEGEHVLAIHKSHVKSHFYDAKVEKVLRVRHSKRVYCRCTFMIKWLHQDLKGQTITVPSSSIMKLATKSIHFHPTVAAFLKSVKEMGLYSASPLPIMHEDVGLELDLNKLLEKQIEEINISANGSKNEITINILERVKAENEEHIQCKHVAACTVSISNAQVSYDQNQSKSITQSSGQLEANIEDEDLQAPCSSIQEEHLEYRSHLSPLAARAALASLISSPHRHVVIGGAELFKSCDSNNMSLKELSSEIIEGHKNVNMASAARKTCSAVHKGFGTQNSDFHEKNSAEDLKLRPLTNTRRLTRLAVQEEKDKSIMAIKQGLEHRSYSSEGNTTIHVSNVLKKKNDASKKKKMVSSPLHAESNIPMEESNKKLMSGDVGVNQDIYAQMKICANESRVSTNMRRLTRSADSSEENLIVPESHVTGKKSGGSRKKNAVSSSSDNDSNMPGKEINEKHMSGSVRRPESICQSEGKVAGSGDNRQGQKRKSTSSNRQEQRFSPRLRFLPRTRSQNKS